MPLPLPDLDFDVSNHSRDQWFAEMDDVGDEYGYLEPLGPDHSALFIDAGPKLLVTFEQLGVIRNRPGALPRGFEHVMRNGWSLLAMICEGQTWFREERVYRFMDRLTDDGFFEDFDKTLFYGNHDCGYAAAAFSVASPGSRVLALRPLATLEPAQARWDRRYLDARRKDFTTRYGYAPDMVEATQETYVVADQLAPADCMHSALFRGPNVRVFNCAHTGPRIEQLWDATGIMAEMIEAAMDGTLSPARFGQLWRARHGNGAYLRTLLKRLEKAGRSDLMKRLCRACLDGPDADTFAAKYAELTGGTRAAQ